MKSNHLPTSKSRPKSKPKSNPKPNLGDNLLLFPWMDILMCRDEEKIIYIDVYGENNDHTGLEELQYPTITLTLRASSYIYTMIWITYTLEVCG